MRILLVEDEELLASAVRRALGLDGFAVDLAVTGTDGLHLAVDGHYDAIVLDVILPGLSGHDVLRGLRSRRVWTPVLILTARDGDHDIADALDLGADDYLVKPFAHVVLVARLRALLRRGARPRPSRLVVGELELDPASHDVSWQGHPVRLTARRFAVLEYLVRHAGEVVSKTELLEHVWDEYADHEPNLVEVVVGRLRRELGSGTIETVRGAGYRLRAP